MAHLSNAIVDVVVMLAAVMTLTGGRSAFSSKVATMPPSEAEESRRLLPVTSWYVSYAGKGADETCGRSRDNPCHRLDYVINVADEQDVIYIDDVSEPLQPIYRLNCADSSDGRRIESLKIIATGGRPRITCDSISLSGVIEESINRRRTVDAAVALPPEVYQPCNVIIVNSTFVNVDLVFNDCRVVVRGTKLIRSTLGTSSSCRRIQLHVSDSRWDGGRSTCGRSARELHLVEDSLCRDDVNDHVSAKPSVVDDEYASVRMNNVTCTEMEATFDRVEFVLSSVRTMTTKSTRLLVTGSRFIDDVTDDVSQYHGGLHLTFGALAANINLVDTNFTRQVHPSKVKSIINLYEAAVYIKAVGRDNDSLNATVSIDRCRFVENERGLTAFGPLKSLRIQNSDFIGNRATHAGAGILILVSRGVNRTTEVSIDNCTFVKNVAGVYRDRYAVQMGSMETVESVGDEVHMNTSCCKGVVMLVGKGGAIRIHRGTVTLSRSRFVGNGATMLGGSIFVDIEGELRVRDTYFENVGRDAPPLDDLGGRADLGGRGRQHALQGDVIYSDGTMKIADVRIVGKSSTSGLSLFRHSGNHWSLAIISISVRCPVGYDLRTTNSTAYGVSPQGLRRSNYLDQLSYFCESCPRNRYSLDYGFLTYTMVYREVIYFTLLINGSRPTSANTGTHEHHKIRCMDCPHGGQCDQGIVPVANFWGYIVDANGTLTDPSADGLGDIDGAKKRSTWTVRFQHCPKGYCQSIGPKMDVGTCADRRELGRLCGRCQNGYSEAWFSTLCVPNESCGEVWLYSFVVSLGLLYSMFLLYQADLKRFIFAGPTLVRNRRQVDSTHRLSTRYTDKSTRHTDRRQNVQQEKSISSSPDDQLELSQLHRDVDGESACDVVDLESKTARVEARRRRCRSSVIGRSQKSTSYPTEHISDLPSARVVPSPLNLSAVDYGCIVTLVYYLQDALLLGVKTVYTTGDTQTHFIGRSVIAVLFRFELDFFELLHRTCAVPDMTPVPKLLSQALLVPFIMLTLGSVYAYDLISLAMVDRNRRRHYGSRRRPNELGMMGNAKINASSEQDEGQGHSVEKGTSPLTVKLTSAFISTLLFMYQKIGTTTFKLLNCVPIGDQQVLFVDGTITCYTNWQYTVFVYAIACVTPFCLILAVGPEQLRLGRLTLSEFFVGCLCPLPVLCLLIYRRLRDGRYPTVIVSPSSVFGSSPSALTPAAEVALASAGSPIDRPTGPVSITVMTSDRRRRRQQQQQQQRNTDHAALGPSVVAALQTLQGPFRENRFGVCWAGVMVGRRLVLILLFTFVNDVLVRLLAMVVFCFVVLLHHVDVRPYRDRRGNAAGTASAAALVMLGTINLVKAGFESAEYTPTGPNATLMYLFSEIENVLMLWIPLAIVGALAAMCVVRLLLLVCRPLSAAGAGGSKSAANTLVTTTIV